MMFGENKPPEDLDNKLRELYESIKKDRPSIEPPRVKKTDLRKSIADSLGINPEELGKTFETPVVKIEDTFAYKLQGALTTISHNYGGRAAILSDKWGIIVGHTGIEELYAEKLSALVHVDKNPYNINPKLLESYDLVNFEEYYIWTSDIGQQFNLTIVFAPDKKMRVI